MVHVLRTCDRMSCDIFLAPRFFELLGARRDNELLHGLPLARLRQAAYRPLGWRCKRLLDAGLGMLALVLLGPVVAACAVASRLEAGPGAIVRRPCMGTDGRAFVLLVFPVGATARGSGQAGLGDVRRARDWARGPDACGTRRRTSCPGCGTSSRGDMSLVGPRTGVAALRAGQTRADDGEAPGAGGITGWAQINGRGTDRAERVQSGDYYVESWSLLENGRSSCGRPGMPWPGAATGNPLTPAEPQGGPRPPARQ